MRVRPALLSLLVIALCACDAGHREDPGVDNTWPGPELVIVQPGPGSVFTKPVDGEGPTRYEMPQGFFDLRNLATVAKRDGDSIRYSIDGGPMVDVPDWSKAITLAEGAFDKGTHILIACVWNGETNAPYPNPEAVVVRRFHLSSETGNWDLWRPEGDPPRAPLLEKGPAMLITGPTQRIRGTPELSFAFKGQGFGTRYRVAYRVNDGAWQHTTEIAPVKLTGLKPGTHKLVARLEEAHSDDWRIVPRPFFARKAADDAPQPGEFNLHARTFTIAP